MGEQSLDRRSSAHIIRRHLVVVDPAALIGVVVGARFWSA
jgi:hypothetical protein